MKPDEFGGVLVTDSTDEFGGILVTEDSNAKTLAAEKAITMMGFYQV